MNRSDRTTVVGPLGIEMVEIPSGQFRIGSTECPAFSSPSEDPGRLITIAKPFFLGTYCVTNAQYSQFLKATGYKGRKEADASQFFKAMGFRGPKEDDDEYLKRFRRERGHRHFAPLPVVDVSWHNARAFCRYLSEVGGQCYRLPTEPEWEYACRAGTLGEQFWGDDPQGADRHAWHRGNSRGRRHPVGRKAPNPWGLYDMLGNVLQWCYGAGGVLDGATQPDLPTRWRIARGSWFRICPEDARCTNRFEYLTEGTADIIGFRVATDRAVPEHGSKM